MNQYLAVTSNGLENLLVEELTQLGINDAKPVQAGLNLKQPMNRSIAAVYGVVSHQDLFVLWLNLSVRMT